MVRRLSFREVHALQYIGVELTGSETSQSNEISIRGLSSVIERSRTHEKETNTIEHIEYSIVEFSTGKKTLS